MLNALYYVKSIAIVLFCSYHFSKAMTKWVNTRATKKVDHSAHPHHISAYIFRCLERMLPLVLKGVNISLNGTVYPQFKTLVSICAKKVFVST